MDTRKRKTANIIIISFILIMIVVLTVLLVSMFRSSKKEDKIVEIQNVINEQWQGSIPVESTQFIKEFNERSKFQVADLTETNDCLEATVWVASPDISISLQEYQNSGVDDLSDEEIDAGICDLINLAEINRTEQTVYVYIDVDGEYHVRFTEEFINAMFGYAFSDSVESLYAADELLVGGE